MAECGERVGGTVTYPCRLEKDHAGPHEAYENNASVRKRAAWEREQEAIFSTPPVTAVSTPSSAASVETRPPRDLRPKAEPEWPAEFESNVEPEEAKAMLEGALSQARTRPEDQPLPEVNDLPYIQDAVIADIEARKQIGVKRYGTPLQPFNGRDSIRDAYEESLDLTTYLRQVVEERQRALHTIDMLVGHVGSVPMTAEQKGAFNVLLGDLYEALGIKT